MYGTISYGDSYPLRLDGSITVYGNQTANDSVQIYINGNLSTYIYINNNQPLTAGTHYFSQIIYSELIQSGQYYNITALSNYGSFSSYLYIPYSIPSIGYIDTQFLINETNPLRKQGRFTYNIFDDGNSNIIGAGLIYTTNFSNSLSGIKIGDGSSIQIGGGTTNGTHTIDGPIITSGYMYFDFYVINGDGVVSYYKNTPYYPQI